MIFRSASDRAGKRQIQRLAGLLLAFFLLSLASIPDASAACPGVFPTGDPVEMVGCEEAASGNANINNINVPVPTPGSVAVNDYLVAVLSTANNENFNTPAGWNLLSSQNNGTDVDLAIYTRTSNGAEPANYNFSWGSNEEVYAFMMHFTGTSGVDVFNISTGTSATPTAPSVTTSSANNLILRVAGFDDDDIVINPATVIAGHTSITQNESSSTAGNSSGAGAYLTQVGAGASGTANFALTASEQWVTATLALPPGTPPFLCPGVDGAFAGSQLVLLEECTETKVGANTNSITIATPATATEGQFMVAVITTDGNETITEPGTWTPVNEATNSGMTFGVYSKFVTAGEPANHTWTLGSNEQLYGYVLLFSGASGLITSNFQSSGADNNTPVAPSVITLVDDTLVVRVSGHDDDDLAVDPAVIIVGQNNITSDESNAGAGTTSGQAVYLNQAVAGATGTANFALTANEEWRTATLGIEPLEFRFSMPDTSASVCGAQQVTLAVTDRTGAAVSNFVGTVTLSASNSIDPNVVWADPGGLNGTLNDLGNGDATYQFVATDNGVAVFEYHNPNAVSVNFGAQYDAYGPIFNENPLFDPTLTIDNLCEFQISYDDGTMGTCGSEDVTIGIYDSDGILATYYAGTIDISNDQTDGDYSVTSGNGSLVNGAADDGAASYTFVLLDAGQVVLNFTDITPATVNFNISDAGNPTFVVDAGFDPSLTVGNCELRLIHSGTSDVCSLEAITLQVTDPVGSLVTDFTGVVTFTNSAGAGTWSVNTATNTLTDLGSGSVEYTFDVADGGDIILDYQLTQTDASVDFNVTTTTPGIASPSGGFDPLLTVTTCTAEIDVNATTNVCSASETVTLTVRDSGGGVPTGTIGTVVITTTTSNGDYIFTTGAGTLDNGAADDGIATYTFDPTDGGTVDIEFSTGTVETLDFSASSTFITFDAGASNENLQILACEFRIAHSGTTDVCSIETITISVFNSAGAAVTNYVGTVNLSTTTGNGTWTNSTGAGTVIDPVAEDGSATYNFLLGDSGTVDLFFADATNETVNINVSDGVTTDSNVAFDPNLTVAVCTFRITMVDETMSACTSEDITITVYDSGAAIATSYTGTVSISTDTLNGNWAVQTGNGILIDTPGDDDGVATYEFDATDNGVAVLAFTDPNAEVANVDLIDGVIVEDAAFDPDLNVTGCIPSISNSICFPGTGPGAGNLVIGAADPGRMVVMVIFHVDGTPQDVTNATFNGANMTQINEIAGVNTAVEMWGILDTNLPAGAGSYAGAYVFDAAPANNPSMCMVELADVEQAFPAIDLGTPSQGQTNANAFLPDGAPNDMATSITTDANNSFILTAGVSDFTQAGNTWFNDVDPNPPMTQFFYNNNDQNPVSGTAGGSIGNKPVAGLITVTDTDNQDAFTSSAHIVASFDPLVAGSPEAQDYEPVVLFDTFSGNIAYKAIGTTLRTASNGSGGACSFQPVGTGAAATLTMPAGSTVEKAYLYWAGSGEAFEADDTVDFGPTGFELSITADDMFLIDNVGGSGTLDYFAAYKDVTSQVSVNGSYTVKNLTVQFDAPWSNTQACAGGWSLIVFYSNVEERFRVANLFHGFQPFQNSAFTLVPRNFRMATTDNPGDVPGAGFLPNGEITHVTIEGDETLATGDESLGIQDGPGLETFTTLSNSFNPITADFNSTVSRPIFANTFGTGFYEFDSTAGINSDGYEIDQAGPDALLAGRTGVEIGASWGFDVDTHFIAGNDSSGVLWNFAQPGLEAEEITTRYSSGQDLVMLISEVITVTNFDLADLEIFKSQAGDFKVNGTGQYIFQVSNNGNGGIAGGEATGQILVADILPAGLTLASVAGTDWDCSLTAADAFSCIFDIAVDCDIIDGCSVPGELGTGESLPLITADIDVGDTSFFPLLSNNVKNVGRMQHNDGNCPPLVAGVVPVPEDCDRSPQFDNVNDLQGGAIDINDLDDKTAENNNVDSIITEVRGVEADLGITKVVDGILEVGETGSYTITVTNFGPDDTTGGAGGTITVTDAEPAGVTFDNASGTGWICSVGPFNCTYAGVLLVGNSAVITLDVTVTGSAGQNVTNTAAVSSGTFNFDSNSGNDSDTDITAIVAPPVSSSERFLISVSVPGNSTQIGGLAAFENHDLIDYNPLTDSATLFYDNSGEGYSVNDVDAVHLYKNGHIAISADAASTVGSNVLALEPEDIVVWDPILGTAVMLFDGSAIFDGVIDANENIDAVYVRDNGNILFSTAGAAAIDPPGAPPLLNFNQGDIVEYVPGDGSVSILIDASDADVFNGEVQVDGFYIRVDDTDPDLTKDVFVLSVNETSATIGACGSCDPIVGTVLTRDDVVELDNTGANPVTQNLFLGDQPLGVFTPVDNNREVDALHVVEDAYIGHFAVSQSQAGSTCEAGQITISKHRGLSHDLDFDYAGSILITTDIAQGDWSIAVGSGTLDNGAADDGAATYTFVPADNGEVTLYLTEDTVSTLNVNVTNNFTPELGSEDPNFSYNDVITNVTYRDEWTGVSFGNNDGTTFWAANWTENDGEGVGPLAGNISVNSGQLEFTSTVADPNPDILRTADLSLYNVTETVFLNFDYSYQFLNSGSDVLEVQARASSIDSFTTVQTFSGIGGTNLTPQAVNLNLTTLLGSPIWTATTEIRFVITAGYTGTSRMFFDNVELATGTTDCGIGSIEHYNIQIDGFTGSPATLVPGISCVGSVVTVTGHDLNDFPSASDELITLQTSTGEGNWTLLFGSGTFNNGALGDGIATYDFAPGEQSAIFLFNYTDPATDPELVNFNMSTAYGINPNEDPTLAVQQAGLLFYNETANNPTSIAPIPTQIAGKASDILPDLRLITIEAVRTSDNDPLACSPLFDAGNTLSIGFAAECQDPGTCSASLNNQFAINGTTMTPAPDNAGPGTTASYVPLDILMVDQGAGHVGGELVFNYADVGQIEIHAQYELPLNNDPMGILSGDVIAGGSLPFVVRPFGFDIDFSGDRSSNGLGGTSYAADADGTIIGTAGVAFDTTVTAIAYQAGDDLDFNGVPDDAATLYDNATTPNYGNESTAGNYDVLISLDQIAAPAGGVGSLTDNLFPVFASGAQTKTMVFDEVGIIDLSAQLVDSADGFTPIDFMGSTYGLQGNIKNVGRFIPGDFLLSGGIISSRPLANGETKSIAPSTFTYMGEEFGISAMITARSGAVTPTVTRNYVGTFAKLDNAAFGFDKFFAVDESGAPDDYSTRVADPNGGADRIISWNTDPAVDGGEAMLSGNLVFGRQATNVEDGPFTSLTIALNTSDSDSVPFVLDLDIDGGGDDAATIGDEEFRYGRLLVENAFGPELEPLGIGFRIEYWDGTEFVLNTDDSSTTLFFDALTEGAAADRTLKYVAGTFTENLVEDIDDSLDPGETFIEFDAIGANDVTTSIFEGQTLIRSGVDIDTDDIQDDSPLFTSAPGDGFEGTAIIEFDLSDASLPFSLDFLSYDWRGAADVEDENEDGIYSDNPRSRVEFGSYRGHDRVINWQEIYIGPGP